MWLVPGERKACGPKNRESRVSLRVILAAAPPMASAAGCGLALFQRVRVSQFSNLKTVVRLPVSRGNEKPPVWKWEPPSIVERLGKRPCRLRQVMPRPLAPLAEFSSLAEPHDFYPWMVSSSYRSLLPDAQSGMRGHSGEKSDSRVTRLVAAQTVRPLRMPKNPTEICWSREAGSSWGSS